jgi:hypothetical protein
MGRRRKDGIHFEAHEEVMASLPVARKKSVSGSEILPPGSPASSDSGICFHLLRSAWFGALRERSTVLGRSGHRFGARATRCALTNFRATDTEVDYSSVGSHPRIVPELSGFVRGLGVLWSAMVLAGSKTLDFA